MDLKTIELDELKKRHHDASWYGKYWGPEGALALLKQIIRIDPENPKFLGSQASTFVSAAGNARAEARRSGGFKKLGWLFRTIWYSARAFIKAWRFPAKFNLREMDFGDLDVLAAIMYAAGIQCKKRKVPFLGGWALHRAKRYVQAAEAVAYSTDEKLLHRSRNGQIFDARGQKPEADAAFCLGMDLVENAQPENQVRFYKMYGVHLRDHHPHNLHEARKILNKGRGIAEANGLTDQVGKIDIELGILEELYQESFSQQQD